MTINLTPEESESYFHNSLCNGHQIADYGLQIDYDETKYDEAAARLKGQGFKPCLEDVWMEILRSGGTLTLIDEENGEDPSTITLADVHERVQQTPIHHLMNAIKGNDDGDTADVILQTVFYQDVIFG
jgi:hypothetical protein